MIEDKKYKKLIADIQTWHDGDQHEKIISALESLPRDDWDYQLACLYGRALNNRGRYREALDILLEFEKQGKEDGLWYFRAGFSLYHLNQEALAAEYFQKAIDFGDDCEDTREFLAQSLKEAEQKAEQAKYNPELYSEYELECLEKHIKKYFGESKNVFHELVSPDIHVDIAVIDPSPEHNYYILATMGMGAHRMTVPEELKDYQLERAEMLICLPPDWDFNDLQKEKWYWPLRWLKILARLPLEENTWLGWGHTIPNREPFAENTDLNTILLLNPGAFGTESFECRMSDGSTVNFYQMIPLYEEEAQFKIKSSVDMLLKFFEDEDLEYVNIKRKNMCKT